MMNRDRADLEHDIAYAEAPNGVPVLKAYQDSLGIWSIGFGENLQELTIDAATAQVWMRRKLAQCEREAEGFSWYASLGSVRQRAIVELLYNLGHPRFLGFVKMIRALEVGAYADAARELLDSKWRMQVQPSRSARLAKMIALG